jgi:hypothetical protein
MGATQTNAQPEEPLWMSMDPFYRALLHPSVRTQPNGLTSGWADALLAFSPSEVSNTADGPKPSPHLLSPRTEPGRLTSENHNGVAIQGVNRQCLGPTP